MLMEEPVFIHPSSVMLNSSKPPRFVVFQEVIESLSGRPHMKGNVIDYSSANIEKYENNNRCGVFTI